MPKSSHARDETPEPLLGELIGDAARTRLLPDRPSQLTASSKRAGVFISWRQPESPLPVVGYRIYRRRGREAPELLTTRDPGDHSYLDQNVSPGTSYYYSVAAVSASGEGEKSPEARATVGEQGRGSTH